MKRAFPILPILVFFSSFGTAQEPVVPVQPIRLLGDPSFGDFSFYLHPERSPTDKREEAWSITEDGWLHISGRGWGHLRTNAAYSNYHFVLEYQWGERTFGSRADRARASGLLLHAGGKAATDRDAGMNSIEARLMEGGSGDILVVAETNPDGRKTPARLTAKVRNGRDGEPYWSEGGEPQTFPPLGRQSGRIHWRDRDPNWTDTKGYRGSRDLENPVGEWNRMEVVCEGDTVRIYLNGEQVNEAVGVHPREGFIYLQSLGAECWIRRFELWPLGGFNEPWEPASTSTDTGASETGEGLLPRRFPWSPEESLAAWRIDGDYTIELVAAEPLVSDPVDVVWDARGRMFVAEMGDYPLPTETGPLLSRIRLLTDVDGDGRMDQATTWADHLDHVQGLLPMNDGLLVTTRNAILFLKDTDKDDLADYTEVLYTSNDPRHNQIQVSTPRWGLDNAIYLNNGLDVREIYPANGAAEAMPFRNWDLRYDPYGKTLSRATGRGQFGGSFDDWGRRFFCSNRNPVMFTVMPVDALERNPFAAITQGYEDIQPPGAPVRPIRISHTTSADHLGTHTAACGLSVYRGDLMPELAGNLFVCEPTAQLVTRNRLVPNGASFVAERVAGQVEFLASSDEWCRPVQVRNGPDGALYICDMYRRFIDHARFFPEAFVESHYMRAGLDQGRIWRLTPKSSPARGIQPLPEADGDLVKRLNHPNAWQRIHAQRLLVERQAGQVAPMLEAMLAHASSAKGRIHALWTLQGLGELTDEHITMALTDSVAAVLENAIVLADPNPHAGRLLELATGKPSRVSFLATLALGASGIDRSALLKAHETMLMNGGLENAWMRKAILSAKNPSGADLLGTVLDRVGDGSFKEAGLEALAEFLREFAAETAARGDLGGLGKLVGQVDPSRPRPTDAPIVEGLASGLNRSVLPVRSITDLIDEPPAPLSLEDLAGVQATLDTASGIALDRARPLAERLSALTLVRELGKREIVGVVRKLIDQAEVPELQVAACRLLFRVNRSEAAGFFFDQWHALTPTPRREVLEQLTSNDETAIQLMRRMQAGEINPALMPAFQRWRFLRRENEEVRTLALELFGTVREDRAAVITDYATALREHRGDPDRGRQVFETAACSTCHRIGDTGVDVGPSLTDVRYKLPEALLSDILDPNRAVEERWAIHMVETRTGRTLTGLIASETATVLEIKLPGGHTETVSRQDIVRLESNGLSLMPEGLEGTITKTEMADLIAFLTARPGG